MTSVDFLSFFSSQSKPRMNKCALLILLLIRHPIDIVLSAIDHVQANFNHKEGSGWPGLPIKKDVWALLTKKQKAAALLDIPDTRSFGILQILESARQLCESREVITFKFEELSPETCGLDQAIQTVQKLGDFFAIPVDSEKAEYIIQQCFKNPSSWNLNKGKSFRYLDEDPELIEFLESELSEYREYFDYSL